MDAQMDCVQSMGCWLWYRLRIFLVGFFRLLWIRVGLDLISVVLHVPFFAGVLGSATVRDSCQNFEFFVFVDAEVGMEV